MQIYTLKINNWTDISQMPKARQDVFFNVYCYKVLENSRKLKKVLENPRIIFVNIQRSLKDKRNKRWRYYRSLIRSKICGRLRTTFYKNLFSCLKKIYSISFFSRQKISQKDLIKPITIIIKRSFVVSENWQFSAYRLQFSAYRQQGRQTLFSMRL